MTQVQDVKDKMVEILNPGAEDICTFNKIKNVHIRVKAGLGVISVDHAILFADWLHENKCLIGDEIEQFNEREDALASGRFVTPNQVVNHVNNLEKQSDKNVKEVMASGNKAKKGGRKARSSGDPGNPDSKNEGESGDIEDLNAGMVDDNLHRPMSSESFENGNPNPDSEANSDENKGQENK